MKKFLLFAYLLFWQIGLAISQSPASSPSPYSDQKIHDATDTAWYNSFIVWVALIALVAVIGFYMSKQLRRAE